MLNGLLDELVPEVHKQLATGADLPNMVNVATGSTELSRSFECERLSLVLFRLLDAKGLPVRRELHVDPFSNQYHMIIGHGEGDPTEDDTITDLNPWSFATSEDPLPKFLHTDRRSAFEAVLQSGTPIERAKCLLVSTIAIANFNEPIGRSARDTRVDAHEEMRQKAEEGYDFGFPAVLSN